MVSMGSLEPSQILGGRQHRFSWEIGGVGRLSDCISYLLVCNKRDLTEELKITMSSFSHFCRLAGRFLCWLLLGCHGAACSQRAGWAGWSKLASFTCLTVVLAAGWAAATLCGLSPSSRQSWLLSCCLGEAFQESKDKNSKTS